MYYHEMSGYVFFFHWAQSILSVNSTEYLEHVVSLYVKLKWQNAKQE